MAEFERALVEGSMPRPRAEPRRPRFEPHPLIRLQRLAGNAAVAGLVAQRQEENLPMQSGGGGGGGGTVTVSAANIRKPAVITVSMTGNTVTDATAQIG